jgi:hypothetical protein
MTSHLNIIHQEWRHINLTDTDTLYHPLYKPNQLVPSSKHAYAHKPFYYFSQLTTVLLTIICHSRILHPSTTTARYLSFSSWHLPKPLVVIYVTTHYGH